MDDMLLIVDLPWAGVSDSREDQPLGGIESLRWRGFHGGQTPDDVSLSEARPGFRVMLNV